MNANHSTSDDGLMLRLRQGDELAFTEIYNRYWDKLYYIAHKLLKDQEAAEGIVQDVFLMIWKKRAGLNMECISAYLAAMTRYAVFRYLSKEKRSKQQENIVGLLTANAASEIDIDYKILLEIANGLEMINTQYWVLNNTKLDFYESWANWRRTGFPVLTPVVYPGNATNGTIPRRFPYPVTEAASNAVNYNAAIANIPGGDLLTSRVWWDK
ncbi:RNA polymerase sigma factor [Pedobacter gandavensis]|uniref:RNA polymerase sigma factor n=1 Tax=Pedobacter gandavensis TaxID=2679963 RepID=UPI001600DB47|nr:SusD/RagB family nutrient-binding outer membrane lipoprotein [Pedobacter gandavensis]